MKAHTWFLTRAELLVIHGSCFVGRGGRGRFHRQVGSGQAAMGSRLGLAVVPPGLAGSLAGTDKGSRAHTAGASWGPARGGLSQFGAPSSLLSRQLRPDWAGLAVQGSEPRLQASFSIWLPGRAQRLPGPMPSMFLSQDLGFNCEVFLTTSCPTH